ncbi:MAG TPA: GTP pyrophosphokinase family protein [Feifaniaceae bacterium]|nr:GTP pyrophosphokinase family protein [Feifaniaceae bacterium]
MQINQSSMQYLFGDLRGDLISGDTHATIQAFLAIENLYIAAAREVTTKLENLNDEFRIAPDRQPIHQIKTRIKTPSSIIEKLMRRGCELNIRSVKEQINDIAGVRVICSYIDDIYTLADLLVQQNDIELIRIRDYIKEPKPNGYRSLHLVVTVPVFLSRSTERVKVEVQIRTIAMDFWASLEHELVYKLADEKSQAIITELRECADIIAQTDARMQKLHRAARADGYERDKNGITFPEVS